MSIHRYRAIAGAAAVILITACTTGGDGTGDPVGNEALTAFSDAMAHVTRDDAGVVTARLYAADETTDPALLEQGALLGELEWTVADGTAVWTSNGRSDAIEIGDDPDRPLLERAGVLAYEAWKGPDVAYEPSCCAGTEAGGCYQLTCYPIMECYYEETVVCPPDGSACHPITVYRCSQLSFCTLDYVQCATGI